MCQNTYVHKQNESLNFEIFVFLEMLRVLSSSLLVIRTQLNAQCIRRSHHRKEFITRSDFFDTHPIDRQTIDALAELDSMRKSRANIAIVRELFAAYENESDAEQKNELAKNLRNEFKKFPNQTHPAVLAYGKNAGNTEIESHGDAFEKKNPDAKDYMSICNQQRAIRLPQLGNFTGQRSYYLMHGLAELVSDNSTLVFYGQIHIFSVEFSRNKPSSAIRSISWRKKISI